MKIFYAIQATGNGHISRAIQLYPYLKKFGTVDFFMSGNNASLNIEIPIKYKSKGCSLYYSKCGGLDYWNITKNINPLQMYRDAKALPLSDYDLVINDFDSITSLACKIQKVKSVQFGHQASFMSDLTPRPEKNNIMGELVLKHYAPAPKYLGLHFKQYDSFIQPPIIKDEIFQATPKDLNHISVYLPSFDRECLEKAFHKVKGIEFQWFLNDIKEIRKEGNITYFPVNQKLFNDSLINCHGILTGGGFETPAEALFLNKKILSIPIQNHYEQECNAAALKLLGVPVLSKVGDHFHVEIENWLNGKIEYPKIEANDIPKTLQYLFDTYND
jgi:uncharacterized protein (TIGR00661 family)